ncbi:MAG: DUF1573 domain-containing protein [Pseudoflavonifractor sp.]|nr:DUF1573 domain-containing protein [Alloprevotella sp.]MCM1116309.1 DUF1573 domain-containing protein [Pseudoflavonifractor sp.]
MKPLTIIALLLALLAPSAAMASPRDDSHMMKWDEETHDFGTFNEDLGRVTHTFRGVNVSSDTLIISALRASCGCTTPKADKDVIAPGDTLAIAVAYDPSNRPGRFNKDITLNTMDTDRNPSYRTRLIITGNVIPGRKKIVWQFPTEVGPAMRVSSRAISFGNIRQDQTVSSLLKGFNDGAETIKPVILHKPHFVTAIVEPDTVAPARKFAVSLTADGPAVGLLGLTTDSLVIADAAMPDSSVALPVSIYLYEDFGEPTAEELDHAPCLELATPIVEFGDNLSPRSRKEIKRKATVNNIGQEPCIIRRAYTLAPGVTVKAPGKPIPPGKSAEIEIILTPAEAYMGAEKLDTGVSIISNTPLNTVLETRVRATFAQP